MNFPPPGYDDETVVPQNRLRSLLGQFEDELSKVQIVFEQQFPDQLYAPRSQIEDEFPQLRASAEELGSEYPFLVEKLISDYAHFKDQPTRAKLEILFSDVKSLQLLLVG